MHPLILADKIARNAQRLVDWAALPRRDATAARRLAVTPVALDGPVDVGIDRALRYFEPLPDLEATTFTLLKPLADHGLEPRLGFLDIPFEAYCRRFNDPDLRLFDPDYDPDALSHRDKTGVPPNHPINAVMRRCLYADRTREGEALVRDLAALEDGGMYGTTHIIWGAMLLHRCGMAGVAGLDVLRNRAADGMIRRQRWDRAGDLFAERIVFLQWLGRHDDVSPAWIERLLAAQRPDGGWRRMPSIWPHVSSQHATALGLGALLQYRAWRRGDPALGRLSIWFGGQG